MTDLKPCPFCGKNAIITYWGKLLDNLKTDEKEDCYSVSCIGCDASISGTSETELINRWNARIPTPRKCCGNCKYFTDCMDDDWVCHNPNHYGERVTGDMVCYFWEGN